MESVFFIGFFFGWFAFLALIVFAFPFLLPFLQPLGWAGIVGGTLSLLCVVCVLIATPFALRDLHSRDQFVPFLKIAFIFGLCAPLASVLVFLDEYVFSSLGITSGIQVLLIFFSLFEFLGILLAIKAFFSERVSRWYHLKPLSLSTTRRQAEKYLADADRRLSKNQFEGASQEYHSAAQVYLSLDDWGKAAEHYRLAAETLARDSPSLNYGVALLYAISACAYLVNNDLESFSNSCTLARGIAEKLSDRIIIQGIVHNPPDMMSARKCILFLLEVLNKIQDRETQELRRNWSKTSHKIEINFGPYAEELIILLEKNLDLTRI